MTRLIALALALACIAGCPAGAPSGAAPKAGPPGGEPDPAPAPGTAPAAIGVADLIAPEVTGILRSPASHFPAITYTSKLVRSPSACWTKLLGMITTAYQLKIPGSAYFVLEGAPPREEVERCVPGAVAGAMAVTVEREGELTAFRAGSGGVAYAAWRGAFVVVGTKAEVTRALQGGAPVWRERIAQLPPGPVAIWQNDRVLATLFGAETTSYMVVLDRFEPGPQPVIEGRVIARYGSPGDAAVVARRIKQGDLQLAATPVEIVDAFKRMKVAQAGTTVEVRFDLDMFFGVELDQLARWLQTLTGSP